MGKKRRRRATRGQTATGWVLGIALSVLGVAAIGLSVAALQSASPPVAISDYTPRPVPTRTERPAVLFIGDSYSDGAGASSDATRWTTLAATAKGWTEVNLAIGGTGYLTSTPTEACTLDACPPYPDVIRAAPADVAPAMIVISGGRNDTGDLDDFRTGVEATFEAAAERFPGVPIYVTNPLWDDDPTPRNIVDKAAIVQEVATANGATFLDLGQPLAGHADFVIEDSVHPNDAGHRAIADAFLAVTQG